jgi:hypothetical protein
MGGAGLLFLTNLVAIVATAFLVFLLVGMATPEVEDAMLASRSDERLARAISHSPLAKIMATGGHLRWRVLMVVVLLAAIAVPLRRALLQVAGETRTRGAVQDELRPLLRSGDVVSQQVNLGEKEITIHLISTRRIPDSQIAAVRDGLMRRTGREVQLSVDAVASKTELADLVERLAARPTPVVVPKEKTFAEMEQELLTRVRPALQGIWPAADAPLQDFDIAIGPAGAVLEVRYQAPRDLGEVPLNMVQQSVRSKLGIPGLILKAERIKPPATPAVRNKRKR